MLSGAWIEGKAGQGVGEWITIDFRELRQVKAVIVRNGYQKSTDIFAKNGCVSRLRLVFSDGATRTISRSGPHRFANDTTRPTGERLLGPIRH
jgi:hypothetical protein